MYYNINFHVRFCVKNITMELFWFVILKWVICAVNSEKKIILPYLLFIWFIFLIDSVEVSRIIEITVCTDLVSVGGQLWTWGYFRTTAVILVRESNWYFLRVNINRALIPITFVSNNYCQHKPRDNWNLAMEDFKYQS